MKLSITIRSGSLGFEYKWWNPVDTYRRLKSLYDQRNQAWDLLSKIGIEQKALEFALHRAERGEAAALKPTPETMAEFEALPE